MARRPLRLADDTELGDQEGGRTVTDNLPVQGAHVTGVLQDLEEKNVEITVGDKRVLICGLLVEHY